MGTKKRVRPGSSDRQRATGGSIGQKETGSIRQFPAGSVRSEAAFGTKKGRRAVNERTGRSLEEHKEMTTPQREDLQSQQRMSASNKNNYFSTILIFVPILISGMGFASTESVPGSSSVVEPLKLIVQCPRPLRVTGAS